MVGMVAHLREAAVEGARQHPYDSRTEVLIGIARLKMRRDVRVELLGAVVACIEVLTLRMMQSNW